MTENWDEVVFELRIRSIHWNFEKHTFIRWWTFAFFWCSFHISQCNHSINFEIPTTRKTWQRCNKHRLALANRHPTNQTRSLDVVHLCVTVLILVACYLTCVNDSTQRCRYSVASSVREILVKWSLQKFEIVLEFCDKSYGEK